MTHTPFECPYCRASKTVDLSGEAPGRFGMAVCDDCAGYIAREGGEWYTVSYEQLAEIAKRTPGLIEQIEARRIAIVRKWVEGEVYPPTLFAAAMAQMVRERGWDCIRWKGP